MVLSLRSEMEKCMIEKVFLASCFETLMMLFEKFRCDDVSKKKRLRRFFFEGRKIVFSLVGWRMLSLISIYISLNPGTLF